MKLSIIIPTLNEKENITALIPYLKSHSQQKAVEIIVVDAQKSEDGTAERATELGAKALICKTCSRAAQMNLGAREALSPVLYFIHADVRPPKTYLQNIQQAIATGADYGFFSYRFNSSKKLLQINAFFTRYDGLFAGGGDQTLFIKKTVFQKLSGFQEKMCIMEDFELTQRAKQLGYQHKIVRKNALVSARKYEQNSYLRVTLANLLAFVLFWLKRPPTTIRAVYKQLLNDY
ncbi:MAG: TIGR04283 family arsenosugar biosynthesis glycosyltransferase [Bacteroidota bacterium]